MSERYTPSPTYVPSQDARRAGLEMAAKINHGQGSYVDDILAEAMRYAHFIEHGTDHPTPHNIDTRHPSAIAAEFDEAA